MKNYNHIFKSKEQEQQNKTNMAISILIDSSGSVDYKSHKIQLDTTYLICKALEQSKNKCEVIEFSGNTRGLKQYRTDDKKFKVIKAFNQKTENGDFTRHFGSGNELNPPLKKALENLKKETINNKYIIVITDGNLTCDGNTIAEMRQQVETIKRHNIPVYCILVNGSDDSDYNFFNKIIQINQFDQVVTELKKLIYEIQINIIKKVK